MYYVLCVYLREVRFFLREINVAAYYIRSVLIDFFLPLFYILYLMKSMFYVIAHMVLWLRFVSFS